VALRLPSSPVDDAIDHFRRARADSVMSGSELGQISVPTMVCWG